MKKDIYKKKKRRYFVYYEQFRIFKLNKGKKIYFVYYILYICGLRRWNFFLKKIFFSNVYEGIKNSLVFIIFSYRVNLRNQKRLAASVLGCGKRKIWLDPNEASEISNANSRK